MLGVDVITSPEVDPSVEDVNNRDGRDDSMDQALLGRTLAMSRGDSHATFPLATSEINTYGSFFCCFGGPNPPSRANVRYACPLKI